MKDEKAIMSAEILYHAWLDNLPAGSTSAAECNMHEAGVSLDLALDEIAETADVDLANLIDLVDDYGETSRRAGFMAGLAAGLSLLRTI